jgi:hypothetical protein
MRLGLGWRGGFACVRMETLRGPHHIRAKESNWHRSPLSGSIRPSVADTEEEL